MGCLKVRERDFEGFLCAAVLPSGGPSEAVFAIRALNVELALVREQLRLHAAFAGSSRCQPCPFESGEDPLA